MFVKNIKFILILFLIYQIPSISKSSSLNNLNSKNVSKYFSGIVAGENKDNSSALDFFNSSKILLNKHEPFIQRYVQTLILENKIPQAINVIKNSDNRNFFEADLLLVLDSLKKMI